MVRVSLRHVFRPAAPTDCRIRTENGPTKTREEVPDRRLAAAIWNNEQDRVSKSYKVRSLLGRPGSEQVFRISQMLVRQVSRARSNLSSNPPAPPVRARMR
jgi:hypothetical protein